MFFKIIKNVVNIIMKNVIEILDRIIIYIQKIYFCQVSEEQTKLHKAKIVQCVAVCLINEVTNIIIIWCLSLSNWLEFAIMKGSVLLIVGCFLYCEGAVVTTNDVLNQRPIIGILSQEQSHYLHTKFPEENYTSYIAASYVKSVEAAGARVVPILIGKERSYYEELMDKINGVLIPGGATYFNQSNGYADAGQMIYEIAQKLNDAGNYFPIFGTCLGFELLIILASGRGEKENRIRCYSYENLPLNFDERYRSSKMFRNAPAMVIDILKNQNVTANVHQFCIVDENLKSHNLTHDWRVTSHSYDENGVEFIASIENTIYPFYGVQFHPEKIAFEWKLSKNYPHSFEALVANRYFMDFFVKECRKNFNSFTNVAEENRYLIYNYPPKFTGVLGSAYHQCYFFEPRGSINLTRSPSKLFKFHL